MEEKKIELEENFSIDKQGTLFLSSSSSTDCVSKHQQNDTEYHIMYI